MHRNGANSIKKKIKRVSSLPEWTGGFLFSSRALLNLNLDLTKQSWQYACRDTAGLGNYNIFPFYHTRFKIISTIIYCKRGTYRYIHILYTKLLRQKTQHHCIETIERGNTMADNRTKCGTNNVHCTQRQPVHWSGTFHAK